MGGATPRCREYIYTTNWMRDRLHCAERHRLRGQRNDGYGESTFFKYAYTEPANYRPHWLSGDTLATSPVQLWVEATPFLTIRCNRKTRRWQ